MRLPTSEPLTSSSSGVSCAGSHRYWLSQPTSGRSSVPVSEGEIPRRSGWPPRAPFFRRSRKRSNFTSCGRRPGKCLCRILGADLALGALPSWRPGRLEAGGPREGQPHGTEGSDLDRDSPPPAREVPPPDRRVLPQGRKVPPPDREVS